MGLWPSAAYVCTGTPIPGYYVRRVGKKGLWKWWEFVLEDDIVDVVLKLEAEDSKCIVDTQRMRPPKAEDALLPTVEDMCWPQEAEWWRAYAEGFNDGFTAATDRELLFCESKARLATGVDRHVGAFRSAVQRCVSILAPFGGASPSHPACPCACPVCISGEVCPGLSSVFGLFFV